MTKKNKKEKKQETIDERLFRESGVTPVSPYHPIYRRGSSIRLIKRSKTIKNKYVKTL